MDTLSQLETTLQARRTADADSSYVASLYASGIDRILKKVAEESGETLIAAKNVAAGANPRELVNEVADLWFHSMVMLCHLDVPHTAVLEELQRRTGTSGLEEKAARTSASESGGRT